MKEEKFEKIVENELKKRMEEHQAHFDNLYKSCSEEREQIERNAVENRDKEILEKIDKCKKYFPGDGFMFETEDGKYIKLEELKAQLKQDGTEVKT